MATSKPDILMVLLSKLTQEGDRLYKVTRLHTHTNTHLYKFYYSCYFFSFDMVSIYTSIYFSIYTNQEANRDMITLISFYLCIFA